LDPGDVVTWTFVGVVAGGLASALLPSNGRGSTFVMVVIGVIGALLGGWGWAALFGSGPSTFLGSVLLSVLGALALLAVLHRHGRTRYRA